MFKAITICTMAALIGACASASAYDGKFPGKGSYPAWKKSRKFYNLAFAEYKAKHVDAAIGFYKKALDTYQYDSDIFDGLGHVYEDSKKDFSTAEEYYKRGVATEPTDAHIKLSYAGLMIQTGNLNGATKLLDEASRLHLGASEKAALSQAKQLIKEAEERHKDGPK
jgi:predicted Zn-dependent protease